MTLIVDTREPKRIYDALVKAEVKPMQLETLSYGDYIIAGDRTKIVIERKDVFDLFNSIQDGRLWEQLKGIEKFDDSYKKILCIEGNIAKVMAVRKAVTMSRYVGIKASIIFGWNNISIVQTANEGETIMLLKRLNEKIGEVNSDYVRPAIIKGVRTPEEEIADVLTAFSGIGGKTAAEIVSKFKSLASVFRATLPKLKREIGDKNGEHLYTILRHEVEKK